MWTPCVAGGARCQVGGAASGRAGHDDPQDGLEAAAGFSVSASAPNLLQSALERRSEHIVPAQAGEPEDPEGRRWRDKLDQYKQVRTRPGML